MEVLKKYISPHQLDNCLLDVCVFKTPELLLPSSGLVQIKGLAALLEYPKTLRARSLFQSQSQFFPCVSSYIRISQ